MNAKLTVQKLQPFSRSQQQHRPALADKKPRPAEMPRSRPAPLTSGSAARADGRTDPRGNPEDGAARSEALRSGTAHLHRVRISRVTRAGGCARSAALGLPGLRPPEGRAACRPAGASRLLESPSGSSQLCTAQPSPRFEQTRKKAGARHTVPTFPNSLQAARPRPASPHGRPRLLSLTGRREGHGDRSNSRPPGPPRKEPARTAGCPTAPAARPPPPYRSRPPPKLRGAPLAARCRRLEAGGDAPAGGCCCHSDCAKRSGPEAARFGPGAVGSLEGPARLH